MAKKSKQSNPFTGRWRIISMDQWHQDFVDEEEEGYIEFDERGKGSTDSSESSVRHSL